MCVCVCVCGRVPWVLPVSQRRPVNPEGQTHVLGDTQVPPLLHPSSQKARERKRDTSDRFAFISLISQRQHKKKKGFELLQFKVS